MNAGQQLYYFGCRGQTGHSLFESRDGHVMSALYLSDEFADRFGHHGERLDGMFCPPSGWGCGIWLASEIPPWKIISWWDNSVDKRGGSHSTFVGRLFETHEEMISYAKLLFPEVFDRQAEPKKALHIFK